MTREYTDAALAEQLEAFLALRRRRSIGFEEWLSIKDFAPNDRVALRRLYLDSTF